MRVAVQQEFDVVDRKAQFGDVFLDQRRSFRKTTIKKYRAFGSPDKERRYVGRADVVNVADDPEGLDGLVPGGTHVRGHLSESEGAKGKADKNSHVIAAV